MSYDVKTGQQLWTKNMTSGCAFRPYFFFTEIVDGKFAWWKQETGQWFGFDAYTGKQIWGPTQPPKLSAWGMFLSGWGGRPTTVAYGKIYYGSWDGMLHGLDMETGKYLWNYTTEIQRV